MTPFTLGTQSASFTLKQVDDQGSLINDWGMQDCNDGSNDCYFEWLNLPGGFYLLEETTVDVSHEKMDLLSFTIDVAHQDFHAPTIVNPLLSTELKIFKTDSNGFDWDGPAIEFEIYNCGDKQDCSGPRFLAAKTTILAGQNQTTAPLTEGVFLIKENDPYGYGPLEGDQIILIRAGETKSVTFTNPAQGCSPGFWQGGDGSQLWDGVNDTVDWLSSGGQGTNPYVHTNKFNDFFITEPRFTLLDGVSMMDLVSSGGGTNDYRKAARNVVAAYLNASWGMVFPHTAAEVAKMWADAVNGEITFFQVHTTLSSANKPQDGFCPVGK